MIEMRRAQLSFGDGLIAEEVSDLREDWMKHADAVLSNEDIVVAAVYEALAKLRTAVLSGEAAATPGLSILRRQGLAAWVRALGHEPQGEADCRDPEPAPSAKPDLSLLMSDVMRLPHRRGDRLAPFPIEIAKSTVPIAVGMLGSIFLPQQQQRHAASLQLSVHVGPIGQWPCRLSAENAEGLHPSRQELGSVCWTIAGHGEL
jgi:hypothetical protein